MKEIMQERLRVICEYLRINENLFFCSKNNPRIIEARRYFCYLCYKVEKIPAATISKFFTSSVQSSDVVKQRAKSIGEIIRVNQSSQTALDVEAIEKIILQQK